MNAAKATMACEKPVSYLYLKRCWPFGALLRKEFRESAGAIIAGLTIYWGLPAFLEFAFMAVDPRHELLPGFAWFVAFFTGWFYAVVVGAHTVCRDWGKPEEHFLLGRPVSPRAVVWAKLLAGASVVTGVMLTAGLWDLGVGILTSGRASSEFNGFDRSWAGYGLLYCGMVAVGYVLAFSLAVLTRQMLSSVLFASLAIFLWVTAPLISSRLAFLDPLPPVFSSPRASAFVLEDLRFSATLIGQAVIVAFCVIASIGAALIGCARERVIRLGYKPLAWTAALLVLLLFSAAMSELGNSLAVRAQVVLAPRLSLGKVPMLNQAVAAACSGDRCYALLQCCEWAETNNQGTTTYVPMGLLLKAFRVDERGGICEEQQADLGDWARPDGGGDENPEGVSPFAQSQFLPLDPSLYTLLSLAGDSPARICIAGVVGGSVRRTEFSWPQNELPKVISDAVVELPQRQAFPFIRRAFSTGRFSYALCNAKSQDPMWFAAGSPMALDVRLFVVDWTSEAGPAVRWTIPLRADTDVTLSDGQLVFSRLYTPSCVVTMAAISADDAAELARLQTDPEFPFRSGGFDLANLNRGMGIGSEAAAMGRSGLLYITDTMGLRVVRPGFPPVNLVGESLRSPLSWLQMQPGPAELLDQDSVFIESGLVAYDVSNPSQPRRLGYFRTGPGARVFAMPHYLVLLEEDLATVLDRPK